MGKRLIAGIVAVVALSTAPGVASADATDDYPIPNRILKTPCTAEQIMAAARDVEPIYYERYMIDYTTSRDVGQALEAWLRLRPSALERCPDLRAPTAAHRRDGRPGRRSRRSDPDRGGHRHAYHRIPRPPRTHQTGSTPGEFYQLYVMLDIFSLYPVGWRAEHHEDTPKTGWLS